jgi:hypothetical protein
MVIPFSLVRMVVMPDFQSEAIGGEKGDGESCNFRFRQERGRTQFTALTMKELFRLFNMDWTVVAKYMGIIYY